MALRTAALALTCLAVAACDPPSDPTPRIVYLFGHVDRLELGGARTEAANLFLPSGWQPGAHAWFGNQEIVFDGDDVAMAACWLPSGCSVRLDPDDGCAHYRYDNAMLPWTSDVGTSITGDLVACPTPPEFPLDAVTFATTALPMRDDVALARPMPLSPITVTGSAPFDVRSTGAAVLHAGTAIVPAAVEMTPAAIVLTPTAPLPLGSSVTVSLDGVTDVMGRTFAPPAPLTTFATTATVSDPTFATALPDGALTSVGAVTTADGATLCIGAERQCNPFDVPPAWVALALPDPGAATVIGVAGTEMLRGTGWNTLSIAVMRSDGATGAAQPSLGDVPIPPGSGPVWLLVLVTSTTEYPCTPGPPGFVAPTLLCIDALTTR